MYEQWSPYIIWSLEDTLKKTEQDWKEIISKNNVFLIKEWDELAWTWKLCPSQWDRFQHLCTLSWLFVLEEQRWKGVWKKIMKHIDERIIAHESLEKVWFFVRADNLPAISLYKKTWWREVGMLQKEWKMEDWTYHDEMIFEKTY